MKRNFLSLILVLAAAAAAASIQLDIPPRKQWVNRNGYCGETSIQQCGLYFGAWISQYRARQIIDPTQAQDVWVPENSGPVLNALRLKYEVWNSALPQPQYQSYLVWIKKHLQQGHPVIFDVFVAGESDPAYDHIITAVGFTSSDTTAFRTTDRLLFTDHYWSGFYNRTFGSIWDTRAMAGNGARYEYCIPRDVDRGCAVLGIKDDSGACRRVVLKVDRWNEPNVTRGYAPVQMTGTLQISGLTAGKSYALLRYDDYKKVPTANFLASAYTRKTTFKAAAATKTMKDTFMSNAFVIYRCVPL